MLARSAAFVKRAHLPALLGLCMLFATQRMGSAAPDGSANPALGTRPQRPTTTSAIVLLAEQADLSGARAIADKAERVRYVYEQLGHVAERTQPAIIRYLAERQARAQRFRIINALWVEADAATLAAMASLPSVAALEPAAGWRLDEEHSPGRAVTNSDASGAATSLAAIGVEPVWEMGFRGQGAVVAILDSGVAWQHPALRGAYRGRLTGGHYSWLDPLNAKAEPVDAEGHGTHVAGIVLGVVDGRPIGVAPSAAWIACRVSLGKNLEPRAALRCLEWVLAPTRIDGTDPRPELAPDVVNLSWSASLGPACHSGWLKQALANLEAAGIVVVASAGNNGPACGSICAPAEEETAVAVGSFDVRQGLVELTSSRGPVAAAGGDRVKPDLVAPGVAIESSVPPDRYEPRSGSSMAAPHVTGAIALLLSARPDLAGQPEALRELLYRGAGRLPPDDCGPAEAVGKTNHAGFGLLRVDRAVALALRVAATPTPEPGTTPSPTPSEPTASSDRLWLPMLAAGWPVRSWTGVVAVGRPGPMSDACDAARHSRRCFAGASYSGRGGCKP